jgi:DNA polymerase-3 subunit delta
LGSKPDKNDLDALVRFLPEMPSFTRLVFLEDKAISAKNRLYKLAQSEKHGYIKLFDRPTGNDINRWIRQAVQARDGEIAPQAVNLLALNVGNDLQALENEVEKLTLYKDGALIQTGDVEKLGVFSADANIFELVDALGNRNGKKAVLLLQQSLNEGSEPFQLFAMIVRQFRLIIQAKACAEEGLRPDDIAKVVGMHPFVAKKVYKQAQSFSLDQLKRIYDYLLKIDIDAKTGKMEIGNALNLLVTSLAN